MIHDDELSDWLRRHPEPLADLIHRILSTVCVNSIRGVRDPRVVCVGRDDIERAGTTPAQFSALTLPCGGLAFACEWGDRGGTIVVGSGLWEAGAEW